MIIMQSSSEFIAYAYQEATLKTLFDSIIFQDPCTKHVLGITHPYHVHFIIIFFFYISATHDKPSIEISTFPTTTTFFKPVERGSIQKQKQIKTFIVAHCYCCCLSIKLVLQK